MNELPYVKLSTSCVLTPAETETFVPLLNAAKSAAYCAKSVSTAAFSLFAWAIAAAFCACKASTSATELTT